MRADCMHTRMHALHALRGHCMLVHSRAKVLSVADTFDDTILDKGEPAAPIRDPLRPDLSKSSTTGQLVAPSCTRRQHLISPPGSPEGSGRACCKSDNATRARRSASPRGRRTVRHRERTEQGIPLHRRWGLTRHRRLWRHLLCRLPAALCRAGGSCLCVSQWRLCIPRAPLLAVN